MINCWIIIRVWNKCFSDEPMNKVVLPYSILT